MQKFVQQLTPRRIIAAFVVAALIVLFGWLSFRIQPLYVIGGLGALLFALAILPNPWYGLLCLAFFIPFERLGSVDFGGITVRPSQITALLTIFSAFFYYLRRHSFNMPKNPTVLPLSIFLLIAAFGLLNAPNLERSVFVLAFITFTVCISALIPFILKDEAKIKTLLRFFFLSYVIVTLFGLYQFAGDIIGLPPELTGLRELYTKDVLGFPRVQSTALEPLYFANYLLIPLSILISFFLSKRELLPWWQMLGLITLGLVNMVLTVARGGYIAFAGSLVVLLGYYFFRRELLTRRNITIALAGLFAVVIILWKVVGLDVVTDQFATHVVNLFDGASFNERVEMFEIAQRAWGEHPWIGIGPGSFGPYASWHPYVVPTHGWNIVNNIYLELLAEHGVLGLGAMLSVFIILIIRTVKAITRARTETQRALLVGLLAAFLGILVQYNTFSVIYIVHIWFTIGLMISAQNMVLAPDNDKKAV